jgi:type I restriction enzyme S subunit
MKKLEYWGGNIPWVSAKDLKGSRINDSILHLTEEGALNGTKLVPENTVLCVVRGMSLANEFRISLSNVPVTFNQDLKAICPHKGVDPIFLFYTLFARREHIKRLAGEASHGTKKLPTEVLQSVEIKLPGPSVQQKIASFASAYDDLIENNRRRIQLLEQSARLLYKEWFVRLRFPGHERVKIKDGVPEGWAKKLLGEIAPLRYGKGLKGDDRVPGTFPVYGSSGIIGAHNKALVAGPAIIIGRKGNVGSVFLSNDDCYPIDTVYFIERSTYTLYLYYALLHTSFISTDVAVPGLNRDFAHSRKILVPNSKIINLFENFLSPLHKEIYVLQKHSHMLAQARDLLLPRLMNGEIAV